MTRQVIKGPTRFPAINDLLRDGKDGFILKRQNSVPTALPPAISSTRRSPVMVF
jgi:hypothetical protein